MIKTWNTFSMEYVYYKPLEILLVTSTDSAEFNLLIQTLNLTSIIGLGAEWNKLPPSETGKPTVPLLQLACLLDPRLTAGSYESLVFLLDLTSIPLPAIRNLLNGVFVSKEILKLGFDFKQDLIYLSYTFCLQGCQTGFGKVDPYIDIASMECHLNPANKLETRQRENKNLVAICYEVLGISLSKELRCINWTNRPLTDVQKAYAAADAHCLLDIFYSFQTKIDSEGTSDNMPLRNISDMEESLLKIVEKFGKRLTLGKHGRAPIIFEKKERAKYNLVIGNWRGYFPWDSSSGGDGSPKFLCDVMLKGLARILRTVGVDAAIPLSKKRNISKLFQQTKRENRVLLTTARNISGRDTVYVVQSVGRDEQLLEVIEVFQLKISKHQLMSRCSNCNGASTKHLTAKQVVEASNEFQGTTEKNCEFRQCMDCNELNWEVVLRCVGCKGKAMRPLTAEEAVEAAKGFERTLDKNLEFRQCVECDRLHWEGNYRNLFEKLAESGKLNDPT